jgi:hypothetical protein
MAMDSTIVAHPEALDKPIHSRAAHRMAWEMPNYARHVPMHAIHRDGLESGMPMTRRGSAP